MAGAVAALCLIVLPASTSQAASPQVRFVHAVPGAGPATLVVAPAGGGRGVRVRSSFARPSAYTTVPGAGSVRLALRVAGSTRPTAAKSVRLRGGRQTVIALARRPGETSLFVYRDDGMKPGKASLRAIHAAGEVGAADVRVDGRIVARRLGLGASSGYLALDPGSFDLSVTRPGGRGGALVSRSNVPLVAGTTTTAIVLGSGGAPARIVLASDAAAGPSAAPATGLGGSAAGGGWALVICSALLAGGLGGGLHTALARRRDG